MLTLQWDEFLRVLAFLLSVSTVYLLAALFGIRLLSEKIRREPPAGRGSGWFVRCIFALAALGILCFGYARFIEPYWLEVTRVRLATPRLAPGAAPVRIVHLSDLHCDPRPRLEERLPELIAAERPDLILFTGDSINSPSGLPLLKKCLGRLSRIAPAFAVRGNWDTWFWGEMDLFGGTGVTELNGEPVRVDLTGNPLWVTGIPVGGEGRLEGAFRGIPAQEPAVFLYHYPDAILEIARKQAVLYCAGHTHGGQVALPFYGALVTFSKFGKRFEGGVYRVGPTWLSVSRGLGMEGHWLLRIRFFARPQVTVIDLVPLQQDGTISPNSTKQP